MWSAWWQSVCSVICRAWSKLAEWVGSQSSRSKSKIHDVSCKSNKVYWNCVLGQLIYTGHPVDLKRKRWEYFMNWNLICTTEILLYRPWTRVAHYSLYSEKNNINASSSSRGWPAHNYKRVCMYICMCARAHGCMHVCAGTCNCMFVRKYLCEHVSPHVCMNLYIVLSGCAFMCVTADFRSG